MEEGVDGLLRDKTRPPGKVFHSLADLQAAINRCVAEHNQNPAPFNWKANPDDIIAAAKRGHQTLESIHLIKGSEIHNSSSLELFLQGAWQPNPPMSPSRPATLSL